MCLSRSFLYRNPGWESMQVSIEHLKGRVWDLRCLLRWMVFSKCWIIGMSGGCVGDRVHSLQITRPSVTLLAYITCVLWDIEPLWWFRDLKVLTWRLKEGLLKRSAGSRLIWRSILWNILKRRLRIGERRGKSFLVILMLGFLRKRRIAGRKGSPNERTRIDKVMM